jgi:hypothetical protein
MPRVYFSVPFTPEQSALLRQFDEAGGIVDFLVFEPELPNDLSVESHRDAAIAGMAILQGRLEQRAALAADELGLSPADLLKSHLQLENREQLQGWRLDHVEFLGTRYDVTRGGLIVRGKAPFHNAYFFYADKAIRANIIPHERVDSGIGAGYAYAFSDTPHGVSLPHNELARLFERMNQHILGGVSAESVIYQWATAWWSYFDAGEEWWGSFLWTLANPGLSRIAVIAASTTD